MKVNNFANYLVIGCAATLALASPLAKADPKADAYNWCHRRGEPCSKMKRAADALASALAEPEPVPSAAADALAYNWCHRRGEPCSKAKRSAVALAEAMADAQFIATGDGDAEALAKRSQTDKFGTNYSPSDLKAPPTNAIQELEMQGHSVHTPNNWCHERGEPCSKVKRAAEAVAEALAEPAAAPNAGAEAEAYNWCHRRGEPCSKAKRGLEFLEAVLKEV